MTIRVAQAAAAVSGAPETFLVAYDPAWPERFETIGASIREALGADAQAIEHVGSTAVPGLEARPVIDVLVGLDGATVADPFGAAAVVAALGDLGFEPSPGEGDPQQWRLSRRASAVGPDADVLLVAITSQRFRDHLAIRQCLRTQPRIATAFQDLKREAVSVFHEDPELYDAAKAAFMHEAVRLCRGDRIP